jgi:hypothetical protein
MYRVARLRIGTLNVVCQLITYPALGLCTIEDTHNFVERGENTVSIWVDTAYVSQLMGFG